MRIEIYDYLANNQELKDLGLEKVYASQAANTPLENIFMFLRWTGGDKSFKNVGPRGLSIWIHNKSADYVPIDRIREKVKELLDNAPQMGRFSQATWVGDGGDLYDPVYNSHYLSTSYEMNEMRTDG